MLNAILAQMLAPGVSHVLYALAAGLLVHWLNAHKVSVPDELVPVLDLLKQRNAAQKQADAHSALQDLSKPIGGVIHSMEDAIIRSMAPNADLAPAPQSQGTVIAK